MKAILTIAFNSPRLLQKQVELLRKFVIGDFDFIVGDNSHDSNKRKDNERICKDSGNVYIPLNINEGDPSRHHGKALNSVLKRMTNYEQILIIDHDCFPFKETDIFNKYNEFDFSGVHQLKDGNISYIAPIFMLINEFNKKHEEINLAPAQHLDTGGAMADVLKKYKVNYISEHLIEGDTWYYAEIDKAWLHFIKGSGWDGNPNHETRINILFNKLEEAIRNGQPTIN